MRLRVRLRVSVFVPGGSVSMVSANSAVGNVDSGSRPCIVL